MLKHFIVLLFSLLLTTISAQTACVADEQVCQTDRCIQTCCSGCAQYYSITFVWLCQPCGDESNSPRTAPESPAPSPAVIEIIGAAQTDKTNKIQERNVVFGLNPVIFTILSASALIGIIILMAVSYRRRQEKLRMRRGNGDSDKYSIFTLHMISPSESVTSVAYSEATTAIPSPGLRRSPMYIPDDRTIDEDDEYRSSDETWETDTGTSFYTDRSSRGSLYSDFSVNIPI